MIQVTIRIKVLKQVLSDSKEIMGKIIVFLILQKAYFFSKAYFLVLT